MQIREICIEFERPKVRNPEALIKFDRPEPILKKETLNEQVGVPNPEAYNEFKKPEAPNP